MADDRKPKSVGKKNILIMGRQAQTIELSTDIGINYIPCCSIVLMCYNGQVLAGVFWPLSLKFFFFRTRRDGPFLACF